MLPQVMAMVFPEMEPGLEVRRKVEVNFYVYETISDVRVQTFKLSKTLQIFAPPDCATGHTTETYSIYYRTRFLASFEISKKTGIALGHDESMNERNCSRCN